MLRNLVRGLCPTTGRRLFGSTAHAMRVIERSETGHHIFIQPSPIVVSLRRLRNLAIGATALVAGGVGLACFADEGLSRAFYFYREVAPIYAHYRWTQWRVRHLPDEMQDVHFNKLHETYKDEPLRICLKLKGFYVKTGQLGSTMEGIVPKQWRKSLEVLQSDAPAQPWEVVEKVLIEELGGKDASVIHKVFSAFSKKPMAAASIGQVHQATLRSTGEEVVVKIQYPFAEGQFAMDMATIKSFVSIAQPEQLSMMSEIEKNFKNEFDYRNEAQQLHKYCTKRMLVMEMLKGKPLKKKLDEFLDSMARKEGLTREAFVDKMRDEMLNPNKDSASSPGIASMIRAGPPAKDGYNESKNTLDASTEALFDAFILASRSRNFIRNSVAYIYNWTLGWVGAPIDYIKADDGVPVNGPRLARMMFKFHAKQLFVDGYFNGDPHPGNIFLLDDGRMGLLDFGQVKQLSLDERVKIATLYVRLYEEDREGVKEAMQQLGFNTARGDLDVIYDHAQMHFDRLERRKIAEKWGGVALAVENMNRQDKLGPLPECLPMLIRLNFMLRMNALGMGCGDLSAAAMWREEAYKAAKMVSEQNK